MWPNGFEVIRKLSINLHQFLLLNTIKHQTGGGSFSELKAMNAGPPSCLYRGLRRLVRGGYLTTQRDPAARDGGRPQTRFTLTSAGEERLQELQGSLQVIFEEIQTRFLITDQPISVHDLLERETLQSVSTPINYVLHNPNSNPKMKQKILSRMEREIQKQLNEVHHALQLLEEEHSLPPVMPLEHKRSHLHKTRPMEDDTK